MSPRITSRVGATVNSTAIAWFSWLVWATVFRYRTASSEPRATCSGVCTMNFGIFSTMGAEVGPSRKAVRVVNGQTTVNVTPEFGYSASWLFVLRTWKDFAPA
jgi:hypothetical protein